MTPAALEALANATIGLVVSWLLTVLVLGYTAEEKHRLDDWLDNWPDRPIITPLIDRGLTKEDCKAMVLRAGIRLPAMYELGYDNANCIGCVTGGLGYFRAIREDFPQQFERLAQAEDKVAALHGEGAYILRHRSGPLKGQRFALRELPAGKPHRGEPLPSCGLFCETAEKEYSAGPRAPSSSSPTPTPAAACALSGQCRHRMDGRLRSKSRAGTPSKTRSSTRSVQTLPRANCSGQASAGLPISGRCCLSAATPRRRKRAQRWCPALRVSLSTSANPLR